MGNMEKLTNLNKIILEKSLNDVIDYIKQNDVDINNYTTINNYKGSSPLSYAAHFLKYDVCKWLLENGADINQKNAYGENALFDSFSDIKILELFLSYGIEYLNIYEQIDEYIDKGLKVYRISTDPKLIKRNNDKINYINKIKSILFYEERKRKLERILS